MVRKALPIPLLFAPYHRGVNKILFSGCAGYFLQQVSRINDGDVFNINGDLVIVFCFRFFKKNPMEPMRLSYESGDLN